MPKLPQPQSGIPSDCLDFLRHFKGHMCLVTLSQSGIEGRYHNPNIDTLKLIHRANQVGHHVYFTVNEPNEHGRGKHNIESIRAIFIDDDNPRTSPRTDFPIKPSLIAQSSTGKFHYYWLCSTDNVAEWEGVQRRLVQDYGNDPNVVDLARIMRVPGFLNTKIKPFVQSKLMEGNGAPYTWGQITQAFPPLEQTEEQDQSEGMLNESQLRKKFILAENKGDITNSGNSLIAHWRNHYNEQKTKQKIDELLEEALSTERTPEDAQRYLEFRKQVDKFVKSISVKIAKERTQAHASAPTSRVVAGVPEPLEWDWSLLQSNPIPPEAVPATLYRAAKEVGDWTGTDPDPAILTGVFITMSLLGKNVVINEIGESHTTHCQGGICIAMTTGGRKSAIYEQMNKPFFEYEKILREKWNQEQHRLKATHDLISMDVMKLKKEYNKIKEPTNNEMQAHAMKLGEKMAMLDSLQIKEPILHVGDITEEQLIRKMSENNGIMAVISDDARHIINNLCGRYKDKGSTGESVYINGLTGSRINYQRVNSDSEIDIEKPVINALLFVQPDAALKLRDSDMFVPSGLAARLPMYFYPIEGVTIIRNTKRRLLDQTEMTPYYQALQQLCIRRHDDPLTIVLDDKAMDVCRGMDQKFIKLLENDWRGHYDKCNKLVTLSVMYGTVFASLEDPQFTAAYKDLSNKTYNIGIKHLNMGFMFATALFGQSITTHNSIIYEALPRKAESFLSTISKWYSDGKIWEGFTPCGALQNAMSPTYRADMHDLIDMLHKKKWLYTTPFEDEKRKLNGGFPDKLVDTGDLVYHLNKEGIEKYQAMNIDKYGAKK